MWHKHPQYVIGATEQGRPIHFHYSDGDDDNKYTPADHHEAARHHDAHRNLNATLASEYEQKGLKWAANGFRKKAQHHAAVSAEHMDKVLPASTKEPKTQAAPQISQVNRKAAAQPRTPQPSKVTYDRKK